MLMEREGMGGLKESLRRLDHQEKALSRIFIAVVLVSMATALIEYYCKEHLWMTVASVFVFLAVAISFALNFHLHAKIAKKEEIKKSLEEALKAKERNA